LDAGTKDKRSGYLPEMTFTSNDRDRFSQSRARSRTGPGMPAFIQRTDCGNFLGGHNAFFGPAAAVAVLMWGVVRAEPPTSSPQNGDGAIGIGIICNTSQQAEQFVKLRGAGTQPEQAMGTVNADARDNHACGVATIVYIRHQTVDIVKLGDRLVQIARINVVAGFNGANWQRTSDMVQYAVLDGGGESI